jgi:hypothetical protein
MEVDQLETTIAPPSMAQPAANASPVALEPAAQASVSQNNVAEKIILDEDVPIRKPGSHHKPSKDSNHAATRRRACNFQMGSPNDL